MQSDFGSSGKNLTIFNDGGEGNEAGSTQVEFPNPEDVWIPGSRWRELRLNKDSMEEITEAVFLHQQLEDISVFRFKINTIFWGF